MAVGGRSIPKLAFATLDVVTATVLTEMGNLPAALVRMREALAAMQAEKTRQATNDVLWINLAVAHAMLGEKDESMRCRVKALELMPPARDEQYPESVERIGVARRELDCLPISVRCLALAVHRAEDVAEVAVRARIARIAGEGGPEFLLRPPSAGAFRR